MASRKLDVPFIARNEVVGIEEHGYVRMQVVPELPRPLRIPPGVREKERYLTLTHSHSRLDSTTDRHAKDRLRKIRLSSGDATSAIRPYPLSFE